MDTVITQFLGLPSALALLIFTAITIAIGLYEKLDTLVVNSLIGLGISTVALVIFLIFEAEFPPEFFNDHLVLAFSVVAVLSIFLFALYRSGVIGNTRSFGAVLPALVVVAALVLLPKGQSQVEVSDQAGAVVVIALDVSIMVIALRLFIDWVVRKINPIHRGMVNPPDR